ncbi:MAG: NAD(P)-binding domain-containing protein [Nitrospirae bacterium]|nr:NAD(P)-binding domain-containing protein [Nitrospirota bacterium]
MGTQPLRVAVVGFGKLGRACAEAIVKDEQFALAGIVRRPERVAELLPEPFRETPVVFHVGGLQRLDAALVCVPVEHVIGVAHDVLQAKIPMVECARLHGEAFQDHKREIDRLAARHKVPAVVGAGWDPGHYVYVELEAGADAETIARAIRSDPLFVGDETLVFPVESVALLEAEGHGLVMERRGAAAGVGHQLFLLEARFSERALAAVVMLAAARALSQRGQGAYSVFDLPTGALWGGLRSWAEKEWL